MNISYIKSSISRYVYYSLRHIGVLGPPDITESDIFLISFPRSGNTWLRCLLACMVYPDVQIQALSELDALVPDIHRGIPKTENFSDPRIIKTHRSFSNRHEMQNPKLYKKNIYLVRHPYPVFLSYYHYQLNLWKERAEESFDRFVRLIIDGEIQPGSWQEHVLSWHDQAVDREMMFIRYEDLVSNDKNILIGLAEFLEANINELELEKCISRCGRQSMREMERRGSLVNPEYQFVGTEESRSEVRALLKPDLKQLIWEHNKIAMQLFDYRP